MEAAIRWSPKSTGETGCFLIADVAGNRLRYCEVSKINKKVVEYKQISERDKLPNFTAFDWSRNDESLVAIGTAAGESRVVRIDDSNPQSDFVQSFPIKFQRKCNSIAFGKTGYLASGFDRARNDSSLNVYDLAGSNTGVATEPLKKLAFSETISNVKFFMDEPDLLLAGIAKQCLRLYDLRESTTTALASISTRQVHFLSIDPLDDNYFASVGPTGENIVSVWDRRALNRSTAATITEASQSTSVLDVNPAVNSSRQTVIWSLRYSGYRRGCFAVLSSAGQVRYYEVAKYPSEPEFQQTSDSEGNAPLTALHYTKRSHDLRRPWFDKYLGQEEGTRAIAFDHVNPGSLCSQDCILSVRQDRSLEIIDIPTRPPSANITSLNEFIVHDDSSTLHWQPRTEPSIANELVQIQAKIWQKINELGTEDEVSQALNDVSLAENSTDFLNRRSLLTSNMVNTSSRQRHEQLLNLFLPNVTLDLSDTLTILDTSRRRCKEGYLFDCEKNKEIVKNDSWLVDLWDIVKRLEDMAKNRAMVYDGQDLSYFGVRDIWKGNVETNALRMSRKNTTQTIDIPAAAKAIVTRQKFETFEGVNTAFPHQRQLCLAICGWKFNEQKLREKCVEILDRGEYYKAIVVAFCHGRRDIAIDLLRSATQTRIIENTGLAAVIACDPISKEQRSLCAWMAEEEQNPYLKALLAYFVSGDWSSIVGMTELPLVYRIAVALKYLDDARLDKVLEKETLDAIKDGDTEGIVLTGLAKDSMDLFQNYIAKTNDLQTAVLATAFTNPRYVDDKRWIMWQDSYFMYMQSWRAFVQRTRFKVQHMRRAITSDGQKLVQPPPRQITIRCNHCQGSIARRDPNHSSTYYEDDASSTTSHTSRVKAGPAAIAGTACPRCGRPMPRCAICMLWIGSPEPEKQEFSVSGSDATDTMAKMIYFCMSCGHGFHAHHAREWFAKHQICAVPDCSCMCAMKGSVGIT